MLHFYNVWVGLTAGLFSSLSIKIAILCTCLSLYQSTTPKLKKGAVTTPNLDELWCLLSPELLIMLKWSVKHGIIKMQTEYKRTNLPNHQRGSKLNSNSMQILGFEHWTSHILRFFPQFIILKAIRHMPISYRLDDLFP